MCPQMWLCLVEILVGGTRESVMHPSELLHHVCKTMYWDEQGGSCRVASVGQDQGMSHARFIWLQNGPIAGHSWACQPSQCHLWKHIWERAEKAKKVGGVEERVINIRGTTKVRGRSSLIQQVICCSLWKTPCWNRWILFFFFNGLWRAL